MTNFDLQDVQRIDESAVDDYGDSINLNITNGLIGKPPQDQDVADVRSALELKNNSRSVIDNQMMPLNIEEESYDPFGPACGEEDQDRPNVRDLIYRAVDSQNNIINPDKAMRHTDSKRKTYAPILSYPTTSNRTAHNRSGQQSPGNSKRYKPNNGYNNQARQSIVTDGGQNYKSHAYNSVVADLPA